MNYLLIFLGGGLGSVVRYLLSTNISKAELAGNFPIAIMAVNVIGCLLAGLLLGAAGKLNQEFWLPLLMIGFLGGFTTFSAFSVEALTLIQSQKYLYAALYIGGSVALSLVAAFAGWLVYNR